MTGAVSGGTENTWYHAQVSHFDTDGIDARDPTLEFGFLPLDEPDDDGYDNTSYNARVGHRFPGGLELELHGLHAAGRTEFDSNDKNRDDFTEEAIGAQLRYSPHADWDLRLEAGRSRDERTSSRADDPEPPDRFDTERRSLNWQNDISFRGDDLLTLGVDYLDDRVSGSVDYKVSSRENKALFAQYQTPIADHDFNLGLRVDDNEQFGSHTTGNLAWGYPLWHGLRLIAAYATAFKAPTFNDLFFPDFFGLPTSNPELKPERSRSLELGLKGQQPWGRWSLFAYRTRIEDLIALDQNFVPQNVAKATIHGVELELKTRWGPWDLRTSLTYTDPRNDDTDKLLARRTQASLRIDADRPLGAAKLGFTVIAQGRRFDDPNNSVRVGGYAIVNLRGEVALDRHWTVRAKIDNLLDKDYQTIDTFNTPGRSAFVSVVYHSD